MDIASFSPARCYLSNRNGPPPAPSCLSQSTPNHAPPDAHPPPPPTPLPSICAANTPFDSTRALRFLLPPRRPILLPDGCCINAKLDSEPSLPSYLPISPCPPASPTPSPTIAPPTHPPTTPRHTHTTPNTHTRPIPLEARASTLIMGGWMRLEPPRRSLVCSTTPTMIRSSNTRVRLIRPTRFHIPKATDNKGSTYGSTLIKFRMPRERVLTILVSIPTSRGNTTAPWATRRSGAPPTGTISWQTPPLPPIGQPRRYPRRAARDERSLASSWHRTSL